ncbi:MAG: LOG family protein [Acidimicrobiia bacterium]
MSEPRVVAVFGASATEPGSDAWADAERVGARLARAGHGVVTGGYGGTMEAVSRGAARAGGRVVGVTAPGLFAGRFGANRHVAEELVSVTLAERIGILTDVATGVIALPGSIGTAAELFVAWNMNHIARLGGLTRLPTVAVGEAWREVSALLVDRIGANPVDVQLVDDAGQAVDWILAQPEFH